MLPQQLPQQQVPSKSLQIGGMLSKEIKKDFKSGNFFAKRGTKFIGEIIQPNCIAAPCPKIFKVYIENTAPILIPYEYFEETKTNSAPDSAKANPTNPIIIYAAVAVGSILIYKYFIK